MKRLKDTHRCKLGSHSSHVDSGHTSFPQTCSHSHTHQSLGYRHCWVHQESCSCMPHIQGSCSSWQHTDHSSDQCNSPHKDTGHHPPGTRPPQCLVGSSRKVYSQDSRSNPHCTLDSMEGGILADTHRALNPQHSCQLSKRSCSRKADRHLCRWDSFHRDGSSLTCTGHNWCLQCCAGSSDTLLHPQSSHRCQVRASEHWLLHWRYIHCCGRGSCML